MQTEPGIGYLKCGGAKLTPNRGKSGLLFGPLASSSPKVLLFCVILRLNGIIISWSCQVIEDGAVSRKFV